MSEHEEQITFRHCLMIAAIPLLFVLGCVLEIVLF